MAGADLEFLGRSFFADLHKKLRWRGSFHETRLNGACHVEVVAKSVAN